MIELAGTILTGAGEADRLWIDGDTVTWNEPPAVTERIEGYVLPGLVDAHCHIGLGEGGAVDRPTALSQARAVTASGVTLVRDLGVPQDMAWIDALDGVPRIIHCGTHIARPKRYLRGFALEIEPGELPAVAADMAGKGEWVKLVGDWIDRSAGADADLAPLWPRDILVDAVAAVHEGGARVTVHTFATETVDDLLEAGVDGIEHGAGMTADQVAEAAARRIPVTPTANQAANFARFAVAGAKFPRYADRMRGLDERRDELMGMLVDAGVPLLMGSDAGGTLPFGSLPSEILSCIDLGMPVETALAAASWAGREILGRPTVAEGDPADLVVYAEDPRTAPETLVSPLAVFVRGVRQSTN